MQSVLTFPPSLTCFFYSFFWNRDPTMMSFLKSEEEAIVLQKKTLMIPESLVRELLCSCFCKGASLGGANE